MKQLTTSMKNNDLHEQLEQALLLLTDGVAILDSNSDVVYYNAAARDIMVQQQGRHPEVGEHYLDYVPPHRLEIIRGIIQKALNNEPTEFKIDYPQNGRETWFMIGYYPLPSRDGVVRHVCVKAKNISEEIILERQLDEERKEQKNRILKASINAQEKERSKMGRELHDNVNQVLTTVKLYNEICFAADQSANKALLQKSIEQVNYCINELRRISKQLSPPGIDEVSLKELIRDLINSINATSKVDISLYTFGIKEEKLTEEIQTAIHRITQEQITNVLKYAYASSVEVFLVGTSQHIALKISDNGVGFDLQQKRKGIGIQNMINRAEALGGKIEFITAKGEGCTLMVELPLNGGE
jgi:signal transduction histidine kinase